MRLIEVLESTSGVWGYWIEPNGQDHEVGDLHGHATTLYTLTGHEVPLTQDGEIDQNRYYYDHKAALEAGWVWMRVAKNEISMMSMKPTKAAKRTALKLMDLYADRSRRFIGDYWNFADQKFTDYYRDYRQNFAEIPTLNENSQSTIVTERREAPLYHCTNAYSAMMILQDGAIKPSHNGYVSLSRDPRLWYGNDEAGEGDITFVLDQRTLSNHFRIRPYDYYGSGDAEDDCQQTIITRGKGGSEWEERIANRPVPITHIKEIWISSDLEKQQRRWVGFSLKKVISSIYRLAAEDHIPVRRIDKENPSPSRTPQ